MGCLAFLPCIAMDGDAFDVDMHQQEDMNKSASKKRAGNKGLGGAVGFGVVYQSRSACLACDDQPVRGHRWCAEHKRVEQAMRYQANKSGNVKMYDEIMGDDAKAAAALREQVKKTPAGSRWARQPLIDWTAFKQVHGVRVSVKEREGNSPMTEEEFIHWAQDTKMQTKAAAQAWWKEYFESDAERDWLGRGGALRLWVKTVEIKFRDRERYIDNATEQGSNQVKGMKADEVQNLNNFTLGQEISYADSFLRGTISAPPALPSASGSSSAGCNAAPPGTSATAGAEAEAAEPEQTPNKKRKVDVAQVLPKITAKLNLDVSGMKATMTIALAEAKKVHEQCSNNSLKDVDISFNAFLTNLGFRITVAEAWMSEAGLLQNVVCLQWPQWASMVVSCLIIQSLLLFQICGSAVVALGRRMLRRWSRPWPSTLRSRRCRTFQS